VRAERGIASPRIGLLCNGSEAGKGSLLVKESFRLLENSSLNFVGNVEPYDLIRDAVDVVVCDGFAGNVLLKTMEATCTLIKKIVSEHADTQGGGSSRMLEHMRARIGFSRDGGALLLGVKGVVVVAHGSARQEDLEQAIAFAQTSARGIQETRKKSDDQFQKSAA